MKKNIILLLCLIMGISLQAQEDIKPCGTMQPRSEWLKDFQRNPHQFPRSEEKLYVPLTVHIVRNDIGDAGVSGDKMLAALCTLNKDYEQANIQFFVEEYNFINNSEYLFHETVLEGADMMFANNKPNTLNCYIVSRAAGNCGYNLPYAGIALAINCINPDDHTWAHEVGHAFRLPHPFLGWEGGVSYDGSVSHNFNNPAPEYVTYNYTYFLDTLIRDTLIIDTALVELVDRSNCAEAADGFCGTEADYLAIRWSCNPNSGGISGEQQTDPTGVKFRSRGEYIMSYAADECASTFTADQIAAMRASLMTEKANLLYNQDDPVYISNVTVTYIGPKDGETVDYRYVDLDWEPVVGATHYAVKISASQSLSSTLYTGIVTEPRASASIDEVFNGRNLYWSVIPFNKYDFCGEYGEGQVFKTGALSSVVEGELKVPTFYPSVLHPEQDVYISASVTDVRLYNIAGALIAEQDICNEGGSIAMKVDAGTYIIQYTWNNNNYQQKIVVID